MKEIVIKGDFTIKGDIEALDMMCKRFKYMRLELVEIPIVRITEMQGITAKTGAKE